MKCVNLRISMPWLVILKDHRPNDGRLVLAMSCETVDSMRDVPKAHNESKCIQVNACGCEGGEIWSAVVAVGQNGVRKREFDEGAETSVLAEV